MGDKYQKQIDTIKAKGAKAYEDGLTVDQCPYTVSSKQGRKFKRIWLAGYCEARGDMVVATTYSYAGNSTQLTITILEQKQTIKVDTNDQ